MILDVDVPFDGPQVLAYRVPAEPFRVLRDALRCAYESGDGSGLRSFWEAQIEAYRREREPIRWRVPSKTLITLMDELFGACEKAERAPDPDGYWDPTEGVIERIRATCLRRKALAAATPHFDLLPDAWLNHTQRIRYRVRRFLAGEGARETWPLNFQWDIWLEWLETFDRHYDACLEPDDWGEIQGLPAPRGLLEGITAAKFHRWIQGEKPHADSVGEPIEPEQVDRFEVSYLRMSDGTERVAIAAWEEAVQCMRARSQLELLVGAWVPSRGPGAFAPIPDCATSLIDEGWDVCPLFRLAWRDGRFEEAREWFVLEPSAIPEAIASIPNNPSPIEMEHAPSYNAGHAGWLTWKQAAKDWWPRSRDRYESLLREAAEHGDAVVFWHWLPDDQGTGRTPLEAELGERVRLPRP